MRSRPRNGLSAGLETVLAVLVLLSLATPARAQTSAPHDSSISVPPAPAPVPAVSDSSAALPDTGTGTVVYPPTSPPSEHGKVESRLVRTPEERARFELGVARPNEFFNVIGTFGYRRFFREGGPFDQTMQFEVAGTSKEYLTEGSLAAYYLLRPMKSYKEEWKVRPLIEAGPGGHLTVQVANIEGFNDQSFHAKAFLKAHLYAGAEFLLSRKWGFLVRGRLTAPEHKPFDYAQAAILLR